MYLLNIAEFFVSSFNRQVFYSDIEISLIFSANRRILKKILQAGITLIILIQAATC